MKKLLMILAVAGFLTACNNAADTVDNTKDSLDSVARENKEVVDSTAAEKKDIIDSTTEAKKEMLDTTIKN